MWYLSEYYMIIWHGPSCLLHPKIKIKLITHVNTQWKQTRDKNASKLYSNSKYYNSPIIGIKPKHESRRVEISWDELGWLTTTPKLNWGRESTALLEAKSINPRMNGERNDSSLCKAKNGHWDTRLGQTMVAPLLGLAMSLWWVLVNSGSLSQLG